MKNSSQSILDFKEAVWKSGSIIPVLFAVSVAVGAPPTAALVTAGIGGIALMIGALLSGAVLATRGPSVALLVVLASVIATLGYEAALGVFFVAGLFQAVLGVTRTGKYLLRWVSPVAAKGMLSALAFTLVVSQVLSWFTGSAVLAMPLLDQVSVVQTLEYNEKSFMIGFFALSLLIVHRLIRQLSPKDHWSQQAPVAIVVIMIAGVLSFMLGDQSFMTAPQMGFSFPSLHMAETWQFWYYVVLVSVCGLLQTFSRKHLYRDTMKISKNVTTVGLANLVVSVFGGLPMQTKAYRPEIDEDLASYQVLTKLFTAILVAQMLIWVMIVPIVQSIPVVAGAALLLFLATKYLYTTTKSVWYNKKTIVVFVTALLSTLLTQQPLLALLTATVIHKLWDQLDRQTAKPMFLYEVAVNQRESDYHMTFTPTNFHGDVDHILTAFEQVPETADIAVSIVGNSIINPTLQLALQQAANARIGKVVVVDTDGQEEQEVYGGDIFPPYNPN